MLLTLLLACGGAPAPSEGPATATVPAQEPAPSPCADGETFVHCALGDGKELRVCGAGSKTPWIRFLYGPPGAPERDFPGYRDQSDARFHIDSATYARSMETVLSFGDGAQTSWEIVDRVGGGGPDGEANNFQGWITKRHGTEVARERCEGELIANWEGLQALLPLP